MPGVNSKCFVPGCKSGYKTCSDKVSFFQPPSDPLLLSQWQRAIPRADLVLTRKDRVCEKHFSSELIERKYVINIGGQSVEIDRGKPRLCAGAVPHLFPNLPAYLSKPIPNKRKKRALPVSVEVSRKRAKKELETTETAVANSPEHHALTFAELCNSSASLCPVSWCTCVDEKFLSFCKIRIVDGQGMLICSVNVSNDLIVTIFYKSKKASIQHARQINSLSQLSAIFKLVEDLHECPGNPDETLKKAISTSRIGVNDGYTWRHISCTQLTDKERCLCCSRLRRVLQTAAARKPVVSKIRKRAVRLRKFDRLVKRSLILRASSIRLKKALVNAKNSKLDELLKPLSVNQQLAVKHCFRQVKAKSARGMRYDHSWILSCVLLRIKSPKAYEHLREHAFLALPTRRTLGRYMDVIRAETGISEDVIKVISQRVTSEADKHGVLMFDEVKLREGIQFNSKLLEFDGLVDFSEFEYTKHDNKPADTGLVFMYRPIMGSWVQSVGMYLSKGPTPASVLTKILLKLILALESHSLWVDAVVCDGGTTNRGVWKEFGIDGHKDNLVSSVQHPMADICNGRQDHDRLYFFSDYVHLFKCIRNNLLNTKYFMFPEGNVLLSHFSDLLKLDTCHGGLRAVPKLSINHVEPNNLQRMNVRLAVQLFSNAVADGLTFYREQGATELCDAGVTIQFVRRMNKLFDVLNAKLPIAGLGLDSKNMRFLEDCLQWLDDWESHVNLLSVNKKKFLSPSTSVGLRVTLRSTIDLSRNLLCSGFSYVLTSRFSQDPLELLFGLVRNAAGCEDHPTASMFLQLYKLLTVYSVIRLPKRRVQRAGRAVPIDAPAITIPLPTVQKQSKRLQTVAVAVECLESLSACDEVAECLDPLSACDEDADPEDVPPVASGTAKENIVYYVAGFVVRHFKKQVSCFTCITKLMSLDVDEPYAALLNIKLRGALHWPSDTLFKVLLEVENTLSARLDSSLTPFMFSAIMEDTLPAMLPLRAVLCSTHASSVTAEILVYYIATRLHWHAKTLNKQCTSRAKAKNNRKKSKLC